ncbi:MAG TPA: GNAT family N-acetyltransferase [Candidatus Lokiarchaeia archaeon]|nr:GNAT family N-acetyltransferase [Candidatus Lokiarchaeia archaeon]
MASESMIIDLRRYDIKSASIMLAHAFQAYAPYTFAIPDDERRRRRLPAMMALNVRLGFYYGNAYATSPAMEGVMLTMPYPGGEFTFWRLIRCGMLSLLLSGVATGQKIGLVEETIGIAHEELAPGPHVYVMMVGVDPAYQGRGYASRLFRHVFSFADERHQPVFIDTCSETDVAVYQHLDFEVVDRRPIPHSPLQTTAMIRSAR